MLRAGLLPLTAVANVRSAKPADAVAIERLLELNGLPTIGVRAALAGFLIAEDGPTLVGVAGVEACGPAHGLLRSVAVAEKWRSQGLGRRLVERVIQNARDRGMRSIYLLTTTADKYFPAFGFLVTTRDQVPEPVRVTDEFRGACPDSATVMALDLQTFRVLFLCTGNSARSQMAEALLNWKGKGRFEARSAGSKPAERVNPLALETLRDHSIPWSGRGPRPIDGLEQERWDFVITVCDRAKEACPIFPGQPVVAHWGMPDPAEVAGSVETKKAAFRDAFVELSHRIDLFTALPLDKLERLAVEARLQSIGKDPKKS